MFGRAELEATLPGGVQGFHMRPHRRLRAGAPLVDQEEPLVEIGLLLETGHRVVPGCFALRAGVGLGRGHRSGPGRDRRFSFDLLLRRDPGPFTECQRFQHVSGLLHLVVEGRLLGRRDALLIVIGLLGVGALERGGGFRLHLRHTAFNIPFGELAGASRSKALADERMDRAGKALDPARRLGRAEAKRAQQLGTGRVQLVDAVEGKDESLVVRFQLRCGIAGVAGGRHGLLGADSRLLGCRSQLAECCDDRIILPGAQLRVLQFGGEIEDFLPGLVGGDAQLLLLCPDGVCDVPTGLARTGLHVLERRRLRLDGLLDLRPGNAEQTALDEAESLGGVEGVLFLLAEAPSRGLHCRIERVLGRFGSIGRGLECSHAGRDRVDCPDGAAQHHAPGSEDRQDLRPLLQEEVQRVLALGQVPDQIGHPPRNRLQSLADRPRALLRGVLGLLHVVDGDVGDLDHRLVVLANDGCNLDDDLIGGLGHGGFSARTGLDTGKDS